MDNNKWLIFIELFLILLFSAVETIVCIDSQFLACRPKSCGASSPTISYPFWIHGSQDSTCGFPGFQLYCIQSEPILRISGHEYVVKRIVYEEQSLFISKFGALESENCSPATYNLTLYRSPFSFVPGGVNISIFFNCSVRLSDAYSLGCSTDNNATGHSFALFSDDPLLNQLNQSGVCERFVSAPVNMTRSERNDMLAKREFAVDFLTNVGLDLKWNASGCDECAASGGRCGFDYSMYKFMCFCPDRPHHRRCVNRNTPRLGLKVAIGISAGVGCLILSFALWKCRHSSSTLKILWEGQNKTQMLVEDFLESHGSLVHKRYNYYDLKKMTSSFNDKIGQGGFGEVYKGKLPDGRLVAVKLLNDDKGTCGQDFINEVASISMTSHVNIVRLLGFCFDGSKRALIYEFMSNGSLEKYIYNSSLQPHLGWETLYQIILGVARGLEYLHRGCNTRILHFDIKPHNILLDIDFTPKISDFGLAKLCPRKESIISMLDARGTAGYIAPEVFSRQFGGVSHKSDVYSYGMMVLEVIGKRKNVDVRANHTSEIYFPEWIYKRLEIGEDLGLDGIISAEEKDTARKMTLVALWCIQTNPMDRPAMTRVVEMLEGTHESLSIPPKISTVTGY